MASATCFANSGLFWVSAFFNSAIASSNALSKFAKNSFWAASSSLAASSSSASSFLAISSISFSVASAVFPVLNPSSILALSLAASAFNFAIVSLILSADPGSFFASSSNSLIVSSKAWSKIAKISFWAVVSSAAFTTDGWEAINADPNIATLAKLVKIIFFLSILKTSFL